MSKVFNTHSLPRRSDSSLMTNDAPQSHSHTFTHSHKEHAIAIEHKSEFKSSSSLNSSATNPSSSSSLSYVHHRASNANVPLSHNNNPFPDDDQAKEKGNSMILSEENTLIEFDGIATRFEDMIDKYLLNTNSIGSNHSKTAAAEDTDLIHSLKEITDRLKSALIKVVLFIF